MIKFLQFLLKNEQNKKDTDREIFDNKFYSVLAILKRKSFRFKILSSNTHLLKQITELLKEYCISECNLKSKH